MKQKFFLFVSALTFLISLTGCGKSSKDSSGYFDIQSESEQLFVSETDDFNFFMLGTQFYRSEPVQLWSQRITDEDLHAALDIYLYRADGSRELIAGGIDTSYRTTGWYLGEDACFYIPYSENLIKLDPDGQELYRVKTDGTVWRMYQTNSKTLALLIKGGSGFSMSCLDTASGQLSEVSVSGISLEKGNLYIGGQKKTPLLLDNNGIWKVDIRTGEKTNVLNFKGTSYSPDNQEQVKIYALQMTEDNAAEILYEDGRLERLRLVDVSADRTVIRIRTAWSPLVGWLKQQAVLYNRQSETYYVFVEYCEQSDDSWDYIDQTCMELAAGKGADILCGSAILWSVSDLTDKGALEDLTPYIETSGLKAEEFFPMVFDSWRDGERIYGVNPVVHLAGGYVADRALLGVGEQPEMEELLDALLNAKEKMVFEENMSSNLILDYFLKASQDLWGTIDWEQGTCDFTGELFGKLLEVSKRYGDSERINYPEIMTDRSPFLYGFRTREELEKDGKIVLDYFFDGENCMGIAQNYALGINANSPDKEGAWEFITFLMAEEAQRELNYLHLPMNRKAFDAMMEHELTVGAKETTIVNGRARTLYKAGLEGEDLTEERVTELKREIESAKAFPVFTEPIIAIIKEEAGGYFDGNKSREAICDIITKRVGIYLSERYTQD